MTAFAALPLSALQDNRLGLTDLKILASVASFASPSKPVCWPSRSSIGQRCSIRSESRVSKHLHRLQDFGLIEITHRQGSNLYRLLNGPTAAPDAPEQTCTPCSTAAVHPAMHAEQNSEQTIVSSPSPLALATTPDSATPIDQERRRQREEQEEREAQRQAQRDQERQDRQERHQRREERRIARRMEREATPPGSHQGAVQRVLSVFQTVCNVTYPNSGAIAGKVSKAIEQHGEEVLTRVIRHRGHSFRYPLALLRDDLIESISAEIERPAPAPAPATPGERPKEERRIYGVPLSEIERQARPGESYEDCALRLYEQRRNSVMRA